MSSSSCLPLKVDLLMLSRKGAFFDLNLALDVVVSRLHVQCDRVYNQLFHEYRERRSSLHYHGRGKCAKCCDG